VRGADMEVTCPGDISHMAVKLQAESMMMLRD